MASPSMPRGSPLPGSSMWRWSLTTSAHFPSQMLGPFPSVSYCWKSWFGSSWTLSYWTGSHVTSRVSTLCSLWPQQPSSLSTGTEQMRSQETINLHWLWYSWWWFCKLQRLFSPLYLHSSGRSSFPTAKVLRLKTVYPLFLQPRSKPDYIIMRHNVNIHI